MSDIFQNMSDIIFTPHRARRRGGIRTLPFPPTGVLSTILIETPGVTFAARGRIIKFTRAAAA